MTDRDSVDGSGLKMNDENFDPFALSPTEQNLAECREVRGYRLLEKV